jgi:AraC family transcriptional activator of pobA
MSGRAKTIIPYFDDINAFLASIPAEKRTADPQFYCYRLLHTETDVMYKPPFRRGFYFLGLLTGAEKTKITYDNTSIGNLNSLIVFQSPGLVYSFYRDSATHGYLIYFKPECLSYFKPSIEKEFPFFNMHHTDFYKIGYDKYLEFAPCFEEVFSAYEHSNNHTIASLKLLALLYQLKGHAVFHDVWQERLASPQQLLVRNFINLINTHYIEVKKVEEYARMLHVTANHLSQCVKESSGKNALSFINQRILAEAKSLISYTDLTMAEIAYKLDFSDPANFGKFFKKHEGTTPQEYRQGEIH